VVQAVGQELQRLLSLEPCTFEVGPTNAARARIRRNGEVEAPRVERVGEPLRVWCSVEMPVSGHRHVFGQFVLEFRRDAPRPSAQDLVAAIALGDQVGAAFMTQAPTPPGPADEPARSLRVVQ